MNSKKIEIITEEFFNEKTSHLNYLKEYLSPYEAMVIKGEDNRFYINHRGNCFIANDLQTVDSILNARNSISMSESFNRYLMKLEKTKIDSISNKIKELSIKLGVNINSIDDETIKMIDQKIFKLDDRGDFADVAYLLVGEYFRYALNYEYEWVVIFDSKLNLSIPTLVDKKTGKNIQLAEDVFNCITDYSISTPLQNAIHAIFYKL